MSRVIPQLIVPALWLVNIPNSRRIGPVSREWAKSRGGGGVAAAGYFNLSFDDWPPGFLVIEGWLVGNSLYYQPTNPLLPKTPTVSNPSLLPHHFLLASWAHAMLLGILQNMVNPSLAPTQPEGSELPTFSYGGEGIPRVLKQYRFFSAWIYFPIRWSDQLNQSERLIYAPLAWITTNLGNGLVSSLCQAIVWTNFYL